MTTHVGPAQRWAQEQVAGQPVRWKGLEVAAFSTHRRIMRTLGPTREEKRAAGRAPVRWWIIPAIPFLLAAMLLAFYPAGAFILLADGRIGRFDIDGIRASVAIPLAGTLLLVGGIAHLALVLRRRERDSTQSGFDGVAVALGAIDALTIARRGSGEDVAVWQLWAVVALLVVLVGVAGLVRGRSLRDPARRQNEPRVAVRRLIAKLPAADREAVRRDLDAAIGDLAARGLVTPETAAKARAADLGMLSIAVS